MGGEKLIVQDTWYLFLKYLKITWRMPIWTLFGLIQPLIWLLIFGQLFKNFVRLSDAPSENYLAFLTPGILIMTVLFGSSWSGVNLLREITYGILEKTLVSPISRTAIVLSRVLHTAFTVIIQVLLLLAVAALLGGGFPVGWGIPVTLVVVLLLAVGFSGVSNGLALILRREEPLVVMGNMLTLPLLFFSPALVPLQFMPQWMQWTSAVNPATYAVNAVRLSYTYAPVSALWLSLALLLLFATVAVAWSVTAFNRRGE
jgi:ABC-2 type transport system permease protein